MIESVVTVLSDAGLDKRMSRPALSGIICFVSYVVGLVFVTRGGIYYFDLFDSYCSVLVLFLVTGLECVGLTWSSKGQIWQDFKTRCQEWTGIELGCTMEVLWKWFCPLVLAMLLLSNVTPPLGKIDLMGAETSVPYPEGNGYLPRWSISFGWCLAALPLLAIPLFAVFPQVKNETKMDEMADVEC